MNRGEAGGQAWSIDTEPEVGLLERKKNLALPVQLVLGQLVVSVPMLVAMALGLPRQLCGEGVCRVRVRTSASNPPRAQRADIALLSEYTTDPRLLRTHDAHVPYPWPNHRGHWGCPWLLTRHGKICKQWS